MDVTATDFKRKLGQYLDAAERGPVIIKKSGRVKSVLISWELYAKFQAMDKVQRAKRAEVRGSLEDPMIGALLGYGRTVADLTEPTIADDEWGDTG